MDYDIPPHDAPPGTPTPIEGETDPLSPGSPLDRYDPRSFDDRSFQYPRSMEGEAGGQYPGFPARPDLLDLLESKIEQTVEYPGWPPPSFVQVLESVPPGESLLGSGRAPPQDLAPDQETAPPGGSEPPRPLSEPAWLNPGRIGRLGGGGRRRDVLSKCRSPVRPSTRRSRTAALVFCPLEGRDVTREACAACVSDHDRGSREDSRECPGLAQLRNEEGRSAGPDVKDVDGE